MANVCAIIVTYYPNRDHLRELISRLIPQVEHIIVVDNTPLMSNATERALALWTPDTNTALIRIGANQGIGVALNVGIKAAILQGFSHVLLCDQDSRPSADMVRRLAAASEDIASQGIELACACPAFVDLVTSQAMPFQVHREGALFYSKCASEDAIPWTRILVGITSGSFIPVSAFGKAGMMDESLFIDYVDTDWCFRARSAGLILAGVGNAVLEHRLGEGVFSVWYLRWRQFNDCAPQRMYYRVRNFVLLCRRDYVPLSWKLRSAWNWIGNVYAYGFYSPQGKEHFRWMLRGLMDGLRGRPGSPVDE